MKLHHIRQTGARGIVTSLHQIPYGVVWTVEEIEKRQALLAADASLGLRWRVVESLPVHEKIRRGDADCAALFDNYRQSLRNLAACGVRVICYNPTIRRARSSACRASSPASRTSPTCSTWSTARPTG